MGKSSNNNLNGNHSIIKNIFNKEFVVSAIIPIIIFSIFNNLKMPFNGIILSGLWSMGVVLINFIKEHKINALAAMAGIFSGIGLIGTIISKNPTFYLVAPIIQDILCALIFFGSLFFERSLIQIIVEQSYLKNVPEEFKRKPKYKSAWRILTSAWGLLNISQAVLRIILLYSVSMNSYYAISTVYSNVSTPLLLAVSITFPKWYWKIGKQN
ncbi:VC0807 family protein [Clostridium uliginosum]|uniref:Intracellular septation protein A n=1 Tax=Clostridium uliginosum TaxID=119641 RepID=A0A1I1P0I0_9CLOT|nr:VC0807 family protein [Clostridium uliginosum]SFD03317.1 Intracellular septation protein A [Clostridium uliginosum]